ncbi:hypothetical protein [Alteribacillus iranensis]|uniref:Uncharacterized protein n=1 Tax=Alteribacillus iranensis TaxID=930128 RepID=A0A1I2B0K0_9BACI|nr:hypothetical protein [Alteribacillus iranensis]SFE49586.1 hypothetical protein SAMN05192532_10213 [Alteribacillus iranensis]
MKKWIGLGAIFLVILTITGMVTFNNKVEKSQADIGEVDRSSEEKESLQAAEKEDEEDSATASSTESSEEQTSSDRTNSTSTEPTSKNEERESENDSENNERNQHSQSASDTSDSSGAKAGTSQSQPHSEGNSSSGNQGTNENNNDNQSTSSKSAEAILNKYEAEFRAMESQQNAKLDSLVDEAYNDFLNEGVNVEAYKSRAQSMEAQSDSQFYSKYEALQSELVKNGYSPSLATPFKNTYESKKAQKRAELESYTQ